MKKIALIFLLCIPFFNACSKIEENKDMHEFIRNQEHDPMLFGWWQLIQDEQEFLFFDNDPFKLINALINQEGILTESHNGRFWYTNNRILYVVKEATAKTGIIQSKVEYKLSASSDSIMMKDADGVFFPSYRRVEKP